MRHAVKGIAAMKAEPKAEDKPKPSGSAKKKALREVISAIADDDVDGAAEALGVAIKACIAEYGE